MALPTILINSATGSDSAASGAGPGTALTGSSASFSGATVTLDGSPDLSGVATDGSHVLYLVTSTGARFFKITAADNGADTVTVTPNPAGTSSGLSWAIGGKRASIGSSSSRLLFEQSGSADGDAKAGWVVEMESGHSETGVSSTLNIRVTGNTTDGPFILRGAAGAGTKPLVQFNLSGDCIILRNSRIVLRDFALRNSAAAGRAVVCTTDHALIDGLTVGHATDKFAQAIDYRANDISVRRCELMHCSANAIESGTALNLVKAIRVRGCYIHDNAGRGVEFLGDAVSVRVEQNIIAGNGSDGVYFTSSGGDVSRYWVIDGNTIDDNAGDGIEIANDLATPADITNNILSNNGGYGLKFSHASAGAAYIDGSLLHVANNNTFNNTSGGYLPSGYGTNDPGLDPDFVDANSGDFTPQEPTLEGTAFPTEIP